MRASDTVRLDIEIPLTGSISARRYWTHRGGLLWAVWLLGCSSGEQNTGTNDAATGGAQTGGARASQSSSTTIGGTRANDTQTVSGGQVTSGGNSIQGGATASNPTSTDIVMGGTQAGGAASGGASSGGASSGGKTVGSANGGATSGNTSSAGRGGVATTLFGGVAGRVSNGGAASGGKALGGANPGGASTGGLATGGTSATSAARGGNGGASLGGANMTGTGGASELCPSGITQTITVAKDGSGQYTTVQSAVDSIAKGSTAHVRINVKAGTYKEKLTIENRTNLCLVGDAASTTILTYSDSNSSVGSTSGSASVLISANDFSATRLTFQNSFGSGSQAVALRTTGQRQQFLDCRLVGYQDTLYVHGGTQYFRNCYVQGNTDFVFGGATAILENCEVRNVEKGSAVAAPNTEMSVAYGIVFLGGQFTAVSGISGVALARPWGANGAAAFLNANLGSHISAAGFTTMSGNDPANARFSEYQSTGSGANAAGRSSYQMTATQAAKYTIANVFGGAWIPSYSQ